MRGPTLTTVAERRDAICRLLPYRDRGIFAAKFSGKGACERHPKGEEIVQILEEGRRFTSSPPTAGRSWS